MTDPSQTPDPDLDRRLIRIESALAHLQHDFEQLNSAMLAHLQRIQSLDTWCARIEATLDKVLDSPEDRDPGEERPPHY